MQKEKISIGELTVDSIIGGGVNPLVRRTIYLDPTNGSDGNDGSSLDGAVKTLAVARAKITTGRNDRIILLQGAPNSTSSSGGSALSITSALTFTENMTSFVGNSPPLMLGKRSRMMSATDFGTPQILVSGQGNLFANMYVTQGVSAGATMLVGWSVTGAYNSFYRMHMAAPQNDTQGAASGFRALSVTATGNCHFDHCVVGNEACSMTAANALVSLGAGSVTTWEDCIFLVRVSGNGYPYFFEVCNTSTVTRAFFSRCKFIAFDVLGQGQAMSEAFLFTGGSNTYQAHMEFDQDCVFDGVTLLTAAASKAWMRIPRGFYTTTASEALRSLTSA